MAARKGGRVNRFDLTRVVFVRRVATARWPQFTVLVVMLAGFLFAVLAGFLGTPVGSQNFSTVFVWIVWWAALLLVAVPLFGRGWCAICPIPLAGEWLQRGALLEPAATGLSLGRRWPRHLRGMWLQNFSFTMLALFSTVILTTPAVTAGVLAAMLVLALGLSLLFERRSFCRFLCPVGGFIGLFAHTAPLELRVRDRGVCARCRDKPCYNGSAAGYGCPWLVFPGGLSKNTYCGLCLECLRTCPNDNIAVNVRPFGADLAAPSARLDEAFKALIMVGSAMTYAAVLLGPWSVLKSAAYEVGSAAWFAYAGGFLGVIYVILPAMLVVAARLGAYLAQSPVSIVSASAAFAGALIPLGLMFWIGFSLAFVSAGASYILPALSDPFGWGWDLVGAVGFAWQPMHGGALPVLQTAALVGGLAGSARAAQRIGARLEVNSLPVITLLLALTVTMLWLLL